jgi:hypothetical protein
MKRPVLNPLKILKWQREDGGRYSFYSVCPMSLLNRTCVHRITGLHIFLKNFQNQYGFYRQGGGPAILVKKLKDWF